MPWIKGQSGNPGGRSKESWQVREMAKRNALRVFQRVLAETENPDPKIALPACRDVLKMAGISFSTEEMEQAAAALASFPATQAREDLDKILTRPLDPLN